MAKAEETGIDWRAAKTTQRRYDRQAPGTSLKDAADGALRAGSATAALGQG